MPTLAAGRVVSILWPTDGQITITPGSAGRVSLNARGRDGSQSIAPREVYNAETINVSAGDTVILEAINTDATYTSPVSGDGGMYSLRRANTVGIVVSRGRYDFDMNNAPQYTWEDIWELPTNTGFDWVAPIWANSQNAGATTSSPTMLATCAALADPNPATADAATWTNCTVAGATTWTFSAASAVTRRTYIVGDRINLGSVQRTDGGARNLIAVRSWVAGGASLRLYGSAGGTDSYTNWATRTDGRMRRVRKGAGNFASANQATLTAGQVAGYANESPLIGFMFGARGRVVNIMAVGDSITEGRGTYLGDGWLYPACQELAQNYPNVIFCDANLGGSASNVTGFINSLTDAFAANIIPDILVAPIGTPNNVSTTITPTIINLLRGSASRIMAMCWERSVPPIVWTWLATNYAVKQYGATDSLRRDLNADWVARAARGVPVMDFAALAEGPIDGNGQATIIGAPDQIHPGDAKNAELGARLAADVRKFL